MHNRGPMELPPKPVMPCPVNFGRQEHLDVQLISHFYDIFQEAGLPLWLRPYEVLCISLKQFHIRLLYTQIKSRYPNISSLRKFFDAKYQENSPSFKLAQRKFVEYGWIFAGVLLFYM
ncbi:Phosphatidylinositol 4-kinase beta 2 [Lathyrus oleraceus]|uniref:Phosphatidylinositol 4-kinase beta 2 n=1 Tax=Pisum sativum TaxID=3888 RepID=A0A9D5BJI0_PEA|nr:Phosphatidylinositol 4-kinase beta 2 [Pisum sativum]